ncbi:hypothetical protein D7D52_21010 [Nocardia yunnanensis]|uniref:Uncharacterized protein n=1 Tax=Nocardia yunnanensis TaxID=2382165 RepID=A0A386ZH71_9NOCA|nr:hypothetical protein [Nocardia yunnanensis]AYF75909.1 hypothetical protein D7D52_21010 [Nocardia yunnanensis]
MTSMPVAAEYKTFGLDFHPRSADEVRALFHGFGRIIHDELLADPVEGKREGPRLLALIVEYG